MAKAPNDLDVIIVGAGFAGLYMLLSARRLGLRARVLEAGEGIGGTWYWNRYPGARCDIESLEYSYQFSEALQQEWRWSERFATQPEILRYANHVADRFDLRRDIQLGTRVAAANFDAPTDRWSIETTSGERLDAQFLVMATGCLSITNAPAFEGSALFAGERYHTGAWPEHAVDFSGKRVAMIGTGSSAVQSLPIIAKQARHVFVFQRTATYSLPAHNARIDPAYEARIKADYAGFRRRNSMMPAAFGAGIPRKDRSVLGVSDAERAATFQAHWDRGGLGFGGTFNDLLLSLEANRHAAEFVRGKIRAIVRDPTVAELLCPKQPIGTKRICLDSGYYETFNRDNVTLVDVSDAPIERFTADGIVVRGVTHAVDATVFATGFDAMTGALLAIDIRGRDGVTLRDKWQAGPATYLGLGINGFPNLFLVTGPGSPAVLTNLLVSIEHHVNWITDCLAWMRLYGRRRIEADAGAEAAWVKHVNGVADATIMSRHGSWYRGDNVAGKPRVFMPLIGFPPYVERCNEVARNGYAGFVTA